MQLHQCSIFCKPPSRTVPASPHREAENTDFQGGSDFPEWHNCSRARLEVKPRLVPVLFLELSLFHCSAQQENLPRRKDHFLHRTVKTVA